MGSGVPHTPSADTRAPPRLRTFRAPQPLQSAPRAPGPLVPHRPSPSAQPPRPPPCPGAMAAARLCRASGLPGSWAPPGPSPRPLPQAPSPELTPQLLPLSALRAPAAASRSPARSLPPSAGPPRRVACAGSPPGVTAPAADSSRAGAHGGARAARARRPGRARLPPPRARPAPARAASWFRPARVRKPHGLLHPLCSRPAGARIPLRAP